MKNRDRVSSETIESLVFFWRASVARKIRAYAERDGDDEERAFTIECEACGSELLFVRIREDAMLFDEPVFEWRCPSAKSNPEIGAHAKDCDWGVIATGLWG